MKTGKFFLNAKFFSIFQLHFGASGLNIQIRFEIDRFRYIDTHNI